MFARLKTFLGSKPETGGRQSTVKLKLHGRAGYLTYSEPGRHVQMDVEISGAPEYDLLVEFAECTKAWTSPEGESITVEKRDEIFTAVKLWAEKDKHRCHWY